MTILNYYIIIGTINAQGQIEVVIYYYYLYLFEKEKKNTTQVMNVPCPMTPLCIGMKRRRLQG
jgi:hypothetical protein